MVDSLTRHLIATVGGLSSLELTEVIVDGDVHLIDINDIQITGGLIKSGNSVIRNAGADGGTIVFPTLFLPGSFNYEGSEGAYSFGSTGNDELSVSVEVSTDGIIFTDFNGNPLLLDFGFVAIFNIALDGDMSPYRYIRLTIIWDEVDSLGTATFTEIGYAFSELL